MTLRQQLSRFWQLRQTRRAQLPPELAALEPLEGLARYAEVGLMRQMAGRNSQDGRFEYPAAAWPKSLEPLRDLSRIPGTLRDWYCLPGAAQGFVLDKLMLN